MPQSLHETLIETQKMDALSQDTAKLIENHIGNKSGLTWMPIKMGLKGILSSKPDTLTRASNKLIPEMLKVLEPMWTAHQTKNPQHSFEQFLNTERTAVEAALLSVADQRIAQSENTMAKNIYEKLRGKNGGDIATMLNGIGSLLGKHLT